MAKRVAGLVVEPLVRAGVPGDFLNGIAVRIRTRREIQPARTNLLR